MTDNPCNCSTCNNKRCVNDKTGIEWIIQLHSRSYMEAYARCLVDKQIIDYDRYEFTKTHGCISHNQSIEYLNKDIIEELERLRDAPLKSHWKEKSNSIGIDHVILLIKNGVEK